MIKFAIGQSSTFTFPVRNSGDIPLDVDMEFSDWPQLFSIRPTRVQLDPGQQVMSSVTFRHHTEFRATHYERYSIELLASSKSEHIYKLRVNLGCFLAMTLCVLGRIHKMVGF